MKIKKITLGYVVQVFDTKNNCFVSQEFVAGDEVDFENENGELVDRENIVGWDEENEPYLPFDMIQPKD